MIEHLLKDRKLVERVRKALAAEKAAKIQFGFFSTPPYIEINVDIPEFKNTQIPSVDILKVGGSQEFHRELDRIRTDSEERLDKLTKAFIGVIQAILTDTSDQYAELVVKYEKPD